MEMFKTVLQLAIRSLLAYKARSLLTMLGIIIGICSVIVMVSVGQGANQSIQDQINSLGSNMLMVFSGSSQQGGVKAGFGSKPTLRVKDAKAITKQCSAVTDVTSFSFLPAQVIAGKKNWGTTIVGTDENYRNVRDWPIQEGYFFTSQHLKSASSVAVIGVSAAENLFESGDTIIGQKIRIKNFPFKIIGILEPKGRSSDGKDQDDKIFVPYSTMSRRLMGRQLPGVVHMIAASAQSGDLIDVAKDEIEEVLRQMHKIPPGGEDDFTVRTLAEFAQMANKTIGVMTTLLTAVAGISLLVGGVGIMNIMLVSVTERTREIGIRMAVGARERDVLIQFLVESITLSVSGGILGTILGIAMAKVISVVAGWVTIVSVGSILLATLFSGAVGVFFGFYPAKKASRLDPIEALRTE